METCGEEGDAQSPKANVKCSYALYDFFSQARTIDILRSRAAKLIIEIEAPNEEEKEYWKAHRASFCFRTISWAVEV